MNKLIITQDEFTNYVHNLCRDIQLSGWKPDYVVGLTRGGLIPAVMISHYLNVPMKSLNVSLRDGGDCVSDLDMAEDAFGVVPYRGPYPRTDNSPVQDDALKKNILIIDDINDTGATIDWIMKDWPMGCFPYHSAWENAIWNHNVKFAVIVDNLSSKCSVGMDYYALEINKAENDVWVEFPYENWWHK